MSNIKVLHEIQRRRKVYWLSIPCGLLGFFLTINIIELFGMNLSLFGTFSIQVIWTIPPIVLAIRIGQVSCPKCGKAVLKSNHLLTKSIEEISCDHCGHPFHQSAKEKEKVIQSAPELEPDKDKWIE